MKNSEETNAGGLNRNKEVAKVWQIRGLKSAGVVFVFKKIV
jgi:hypothetical protein